MVNTKALDSYKTNQIHNYQLLLGYITELRIDIDIHLIISVGQYQTFRRIGNKKNR